jgi:hypothetical protein
MLERRQRPPPPNDAQKGPPGGFLNEYDHVTAPEPGAAAQRPDQVKDPFARPGAQRP